MSRADNPTPPPLPPGWRNAWPPAKWRAWYSALTDDQRLQWWRDTFPGGVTIRHARDAAEAAKAQAAWQRGRARQVHIAHVRARYEKAVREKRAAGVEPTDQQIAQTLGIMGGAYGKQKNYDRAAQVREWRRKGWIPESPADVRDEEPHT